MRQLETPARTRTSRTLRRSTAAVVGVALLAVACGEDAVTGQGAVSAAEARVSAAQTNLTEAEQELTSAGQAFCTEAKDYVVAIDRYGKLFVDTKATVGDVRTAGADLVAPRGSVSSAADAVGEAQTGVADAQKELADAQAALANAQATASSVPTSSTTPSSTTTSTIVPPATIDRVKQAETDLANTSKGITESTPLVQATVEYNSAAFALQVVWAKLLVDAGCLTDDQQAEAVAQVTQYTAALQAQLQKAGYYAGAIDGIYGPKTVEAVKQLQTASGLPVTGLVDQATALALDKKLVGLGQQASAQISSQTAALQTVLALTGYWTGPVDGVWTDDLTEALMAFQTALGVEPTGAVDAATLAAFEQALAEMQTSTATTTTTSPSSTTSTSAATTTSTAASATTTGGTTSTHVTT